MSEPKLDAKVGVTKSFEIGGEKVLVQALPYGKIKKIMRLIVEVIGKMSDNSNNKGQDLMQILPSMFAEYLDQFVPLLFDEKAHPFMTKEWIDDNLTIPQMRLIVEAAITVNGLQDFFAQTAKATATVIPKPVESSLSETNPTPPENSGSTISLESPTDGSLKK